MYSAKEAAEITGLSTAALRYYEREKLLPQIRRSSQKYRQYTEEDIEWIKMIQCMRMANIPIQSIKQYVSLLIQGGTTLEQRYRMVQAHMENIKKQIADLQNAFALTQSKLSFYEKLLKDPMHQNITYIDEWNLFQHGGL
ncbi:MAG: MerR family transcriptional regulator [Lachnospiraceae bacterium]|uniref:MerR family transcriptional regulator n=1 Tax=Candidatus Merdisoma sp. JLR.KK006 TaxID=3112626 RepID=UPI002FF225DB|nr:MerR family transcriptional regulator [Lachnospiraceae bacterium]MCI9595491.1 MerR family transcriptional regulator [Lachnospiraceae bacterium]